MFRKLMLIATACCGALVLCSCLGTTEDSEMRVSYVDRKTVEKLADDDILSQSIDMNQMKKEKKLGIGINLDVQTLLSPELQEKAKMDLEQFSKLGYERAKTYLIHAKAYNVYILPKGTKKDALMSGKEFNNVKYSFLIDFHLTLSAELSQRFDEDEWLYKTSLKWQLIDNRTKANGLGKLEAPVGKEALECDFHTSRKTKVGGVTGRRMAGEARENLKNCFADGIGNCMIQFLAQLSNRIPYGGKISSMRLRDGKLRMTLRAGPSEGIQQRMQMLIINEEGDHVAVATATGGADAKSTTLNVWRWLSPSLKKSILAVAGDKKKSEAWLEEEGNMLYAICLGTPTPTADEIKKYSSR